jgi:hypothetical protein
VLGNLAGAVWSAEVVEGARGGRGYGDFLSGVRCHEAAIWVVMCGGLRE